MEGEFLVVNQIFGELPGYREVFGFYDSEGEAAVAVAALKKQHISFGVFRLHVLADDVVERTKVEERMRLVEMAEPCGVWGTASKEDVEFLARMVLRIVQASDLEDDHQREQRERTG